MEKKTKNYAWFYSLLKDNPYADKESLVLQYTDGRTSSLREMSSAEYEAMCRDLERGSRPHAEEDRTRLKKARSAVLLRLARLGLDTVDNWDGIDAFCMSPKIAGKKFSRLGIGELEALVKKLENILHKGGLKQERPERRDISVMPIFYRSNKWLS